MIRAFWTWLTGRPHEPPRVDYDPNRDPLVRQFRLERRHAERATKRITRELERQPYTPTGNPLADRYRGVHDEPGG